MQDRTCSLLTNELEILQPHGEALTFEDGNVTLVGTYGINPMQEQVISESSTHRLAF